MGDSGGFDATQNILSKLKFAFEGSTNQTYKRLFYVGRSVLLTCNVAMGKIIFYEDRNFQGRHYECSGDCADMHSHFTRCNSIRVDSGCWVAYEKPNYMGYQYMLTRGKYPDHHRWSGFNDCIRSCRMIPAYNGNYRMKIFERADFGGRMMELMDDCPNLMDRFHVRDISSCNVLEGYWILHEHPNYRGRQYFLKPGEYSRHSAWGGMSSTIGSLRRVTDLN